MIYSKNKENPKIRIFNVDCMQYMKTISNDKIIVVTDPPFNIGYHYEEYKDKIPEEMYLKMLKSFIDKFPTVIIHYPESLHKLSIACGVAPNKVVSWVYNSNTAKQHRDIAYYNVLPNFRGALQPYKNLNDKRIVSRIQNGKLGGRMYDWWNVNQVKNVSKSKTEHPCQMPVEVMKNIVSTLPKDCIVFDPFMGSGTTGVACVELGYDFIGCEIDKKYFNIAKNRLKSLV